MSIDDYYLVESEALVVSEDGCTVNKKVRRICDRNISYPTLEYIKVACIRFRFFYFQIAGALTIWFNMRTK